MKLSYLLFAITYLKNPTICLNMIRKIETNIPTFDEEFTLFRYNRIVEDHLLIKHKSTQALDVSFEISFKRFQNIFYNIIQKIAKNLVEFWDMISRDEKSIFNSK